MLSRDLTSIAYPALDLRVAELNVRIDAPPGVMAVLEATLAVVPRAQPGASPDLVISAQTRDDVWEIRGNEGSLKVLSVQSALPRIGGAVVTSTIHDVAIKRGYRTMRATVVAKDGRALAMFGDDWESAITLAAHLHGRGWSYVGSDNALLDPVTLEVLPVQKSLYVNSSAVVQFPAHYRRAVEASPWYVTPQGISFYAVDPRAAGHWQTWATSARLCGVIVVDGMMANSPSLESLDADRLNEERFARLQLDWSLVDVADLRLAGCVETCDLIEHWFSSVQP